MADGTVLRQSVEQADTASLRDAYTALQALSPTDNRSWVYWCGIHGFPQFACWHHSREGNTGFPYDLFLPWHRAYLSYFDHATRDHNDHAIVPWWDWTSDLSHRVGVPAAYTEAQVNGGRNPLESGPMPDMPDDPAHQTRRFPGDPSELPTADQVDSVLNLSSYVDFSSQLQDIHDQIHGWVGGINPDDPRQGGDMGVIATSAFDPLFWAHHCMIDRLWYLWQLRQGVDNIPPDYLARTLAPFSYTVSDVLDIGHLGYEYADSSASAPGT